MISVIVPAYKEQDYIWKCKVSIKKSISICPCPVELIIVENLKGIGRARNYGAMKSIGDILVFVDVDCTLSPGFLKEVYEKSQNEMNAGGGVKYVRFDRYSIGRMAFMLCMGIWLYIHQVSFGSFWIRRDFFKSMGGFIEDNDTKIDLDFALRLKKTAKKNGRNFRSIKQNHIVWSTRSFDKYGEWFWIKKYKLYQN